MKKIVLALSFTLLAGSVIAKPQQTISWEEWGTLDATGMAELVSSGKMTAKQVAEQAQFAAQLMNPEVNSVVEVFEDVVENPTKDGMNVDGPFHGVPMLVKDTGSRLKGRVQGKSAVLHNNDAPSDHDDPLMSNFRDAGFNILGRATMGSLHIASSLATGYTLNPWNLDRTSGGSSGGSAASVAAGIVPIAQTSDGGGSTRSPATLNGLIGHKATRGMIPLPAGYSYDSAYMLMEGFISKSVRDQAAIYDEIMKFPENQAHFIVPEMPDVPFKEQIKSDPAKLKIAVNAGDWGRRGADETSRYVTEEAKQRTYEIAKQFEELGHEVTFVTEEQMGIDHGAALEQFKWFYLYIYDWKGQAEAAGMDINSDTLEPAYIAAMNYAEKHPMPLGMIDYARIVNGQVSGQWGEFFSEYDILLTPTDLGSATESHGKGALSPFTELKTDEEYLNWVEDHIDDARYMIQANTLGYPAISLPAGTYKDGLPAGVQLHSKWGNDGLIFQLSAQLERAHPENFNMVAPHHISKK